MLVSRYRLCDILLNSVIAIYVKNYFLLQLEWYLPIVVGNIKKHSLSDYWNHGLNDIWSKHVIQYLVSRMQSIHDMEELTDKIADINMDNGLRLDLMECDLDDLNLIKGVILE